MVENGARRVATKMIKGNVGISGTALAEPGRTEETTSFNWASDDPGGIIAAAGQTLADFNESMLETDIAVAQILDPAWQTRKGELVRAWIGADVSEGPEAPSGALATPKSKRYNDGITVATKPTNYWRESQVDDFVIKPAEEAWAANPTWSRRQLADIREAAIRYKDEIRRLNALADVQIANDVRFFGRAWLKGASFLGGGFGVVATAADTAIDFANGDLSAGQAASTLASLGAHKFKGLTFASSGGASSGSRATLDAASRLNLKEAVGSTKSLSEAKGLVFAQREGMRLGYDRVLPTLNYRGSHGIDLALQNSGSLRFATFEAKGGHSQTSLSALKIDVLGITQGSRDFISTRLERYVRYGDGTNVDTARSLLGAMRSRNLDSFASFHGSRTTYQLPLTGSTVRPAQIVP